MEGGYPEPPTFHSTFLFLYRYRLLHIDPRTISVALTARSRNEQLNVAFARASKEPNPDRSWQRADGVLWVDTVSADTIAA